KPSGLANLWGLQSVVYVPQEPWLSLSIAISALLTLVVFVLAFRFAARLIPPAAVATVMCLLAVELFTVRSDFGLFKLAMFLQPFMLPVLALATATTAR